MMLGRELDPTTLDPAAECAALVRREFERSPYLAVRKLVCHPVDGRLIIRGAVPNFHTRQVALKLLSRYSALVGFEDQIKVSERTPPVATLSLGLG